MPKNNFGPNVISFPVCRPIGDRHWFGGRGFKTVEDVLDSLSDLDWRRVIEWERRNAAWVMSKRGGGDKHSGGGSAA